MSLPSPWRTNYLDSREASNNKKKRICKKILLFESLQTFANNLLIYFLGNRKLSKDFLWVHISPTKIKKDML